MLGGITPLARRCSSLMASGEAGFDAVRRVHAANGNGEHSPGKYSLTAGFVHGE